MTTLPYVLVRVHPDGAQDLVSEHPDFESGWAEGQRMTHEDSPGAYHLLQSDRRVAKFGHSRLTPKRKATSIDFLVVSAD